MSSIENQARADRPILDAAYRIINMPRLSGMLRSYRLLWEVAALTPATARDAVLYQSDAAGFETQAQTDAARVTPLLDETSVVLDLGCGVGRVMRYVAPACRELHGVDISRGMLRHARRRLVGVPNVRLHQNNGKDLRAVRDSSFDVVYSFLVLQHLEREDAYVYLEEIRRVLKPTGKTLLQFADLKSESGSQWFTGYARAGSRHAARVRPIVDCEVEWLLSSVGLRLADLVHENGYLYATATASDA